MPGSKKRRPAHSPSLTEVTGSFLGTRPVHGYPCGAMCNSPGKQRTEHERVFLEPTAPTHRQYEALRAYFIEGRPSHAGAKRFGYTPGSFRVLCHQCRHPPPTTFLHPTTHRTPPRPKT
jgi:hypothetical protein